MFKSLAVNAEKTVNSSSGCFCQLLSGGLLGWQVATLEMMPNAARFQQALFEKARVFSDLFAKKTLVPC